MTATAARCRSCGAPVLWAWVVRGTALPDARGKARRGAWVVPFDLEPGLLGTAVLLDCGGDLVAFEGAGDGPRHASHFATCPQRDRWRGGRDVREAT